MKTALVALLGLAAGCALGAVVASLRARPDAAPARAARPASREGEDEAASRPAPPESPGSESRVADALRAHFVAEYRAGWGNANAGESPNREDLERGLGKYLESVKGTARELGVQAGARRAEELRLRGALRSGEAVATMLALDRLRMGPPRELAADRNQLAHFFERRHAEEIVECKENVHACVPSGAIDEGTTLLFPEGTFRVVLVSQAPFPCDMTIAGDGMDRTLLDIGMELRHPVANLTIRDCTVVPAARLFELRSAQPVQLRLERVRFACFDSGPGNLAAIRAYQLVLWATDSRFEGGYGSLPEHAALLEIETSAVIARFERCTISRVGLRVPENGIVVLADCELERIGSGFESCLRQGKTVMETPLDSLVRLRLDFDDAFPQWRGARHR